MLSSGRVGEVVVPVVVVVDLDLVVFPELSEEAGSLADLHP